MLAGETIGILAGWGRFPMAVAEAIRRHGGRTAVLAIRGHADQDLERCADVFGEVGVAEIGGAIAFFRRAGCRRATMAGKIHKTKVFGNGRWRNLLPASMVRQPPPASRRKPARPPRPARRAT